MNYFANKNECSGGKAPRALSGTVSELSAVSNSKAQQGEAPVSLKISWHVSPAQDVPIRDLSCQTGGLGLTPSAAAKPGHSRPQKGKYL
jgi:hypothetical protein